MREMLKRRQFIFGKQNINRHQPQVDDVVTSVYTQYNNASNVPDEGDVDAVMKFCPSKTDVANMLKQMISGQGGELNISEKDIEFLDTFIYFTNAPLLPKQFQTRSQIDSNAVPYAYHVGYMYRIIGGTVTLPNGQVVPASSSGSIILFSGPILIYKGKLTEFIKIRPTSADFTKYFPYVNNNTSFTPMDAALGWQPSARLFIQEMVLGFNIEATEDESLIQENVLPLLGDTVEVTSDTVKYIEHKLLIGVNKDLN